MTPHQQPFGAVVVAAAAAYDCIAQQGAHARQVIVTDVSTGSVLEFVDAAGDTVTISSAYAGLVIDAWIQSTTANTTCDEYVLGFE